MSFDKLLTLVKIQIVEMEFIDVIKTHIKSTKHWVMLIQITLRNSMLPSVSKNEQ